MFRDAASPLTTRWRRWRFDELPRITARFDSWKIVFVAIDEILGDSERFAVDAFAQMPRRKLDRIFQTTSFVLAHAGAVDDNAATALFGPVGKTNNIADMARGDFRFLRLHFHVSTTLDELRHHLRIR